MGIHPPPRCMDLGYYGIRLTRGRHASYWTESVCNNKIIFEDEICITFQTIAIVIGMVVVNADSSSLAIVISVVVATTVVNYLLRTFWAISFGTIA